MKIALEPFSMELFQEMLPLAQKSWNESTLVKAKTCAFYGEREFDIEPDAEQYRKIEDAGNLLIFTLRDEEPLVGYLVGVLANSWHHKHVICAYIDCVYLEPSHRAYTPVVIETFEQVATQRGAKIVAWPTHVDGPGYPVAKALGYVGDDLVMEKQLCASSVQ